MVEERDLPAGIMEFQRNMQINALFRREGPEYGTVPALQLACLRAQENWGEWRFSRNPLIIEGRGAFTIF